MMDLSQTLMSMHKPHGCQNRVSRMEVVDHTLSNMDKIRFDEKYSVDKKKIHLPMKVEVKGTYKCVNCAKKDVKSNTN
jgi:hypothetical protein